MLLNNAKQDVQINGSFKTSGFKIQASSKAFDILSSNIYKHKVRAVVREISCNAVDSHTAAGNPDPIQVHLPTRLESHFSVRDYGTGLSDEDVREIFTTYFCSTKTSSNDFVGALGLGSKSPFCLVDSFTVTSYFNGTKNLYSCYRDENGEPQVALLTSDDTTEPNGVEVSMAVEDRHIDEFTEEATEVYFYFNQIPEINKQSVVDAIAHRKSKIRFDNADVCVEKWSGWNGLNAVMGGVCYQVPGSISTPNITGYMKFEMGEISFDAGRESLSLDDKTVDAIAAKCEKIKDSLAAEIINIIEIQPTAFTRAKMAHEMQSAPGVKHDDLEKFRLPTTTDSMTYYSGGGWRSSVDSSETKYLPVGANIRYFRYQPRFAGRIKQEVKATRKTIILLTDKQIAETQIDLDVLENLDILPKVENVTRNGKTYQKPASILVWNDRDHYRKANNWNTVEDIPVTEKVYVTVHRNEIEDCGQGLVSLVHQLGIKVYGVKNAYKNTSAFTNGNWISVKDYVEREYKTQFDNASFTGELEWEKRDNAELIISVSNRINCEIVKAFIEAWNGFGNNDVLLNIGKMMRWEIKYNNCLNEAYAEILKAHPMMAYFDVNYRDDIDIAKNTLVDYLNRGA